MNTLILPILFIFVGNLIVPLTSEWCTVMKDVLKSRLVTVQDTKRQARRHYFWPSTYVDIPINYTKMETYIEKEPHKECCTGYRQNNDECLPVCLPECPQHSTCLRPSYCECEPGYRLNHFGICEPVCNPECDENAYCAPSNQCFCREGYEMNKDKTHCKAVCTNGCPVNAECLAPEQCQCKVGYQMKLTSWRTPFCEPICEQQCPTFSKCEAPNNCECENGYELKYHNDTDSNGFLKCDPICQTACHHGHCHAPDLCICDEGYLMDDHNRCQPICSKPCLFGSCVAPEICKCFEGYRLTGEDSSECKPICEPPCINAICAAPDFCVCHLGYKYEKMDSFQVCVEETTNLSVMTSPEDFTTEQNVYNTEQSASTSYNGSEEASTTFPATTNLTLGVDCLSNCQCWQKMVINATEQNKQCITTCTENIIHSCLNISTCVGCDLSTKRLQCPGMDKDEYLTCYDWQPIAADLVLQQNVENSNKRSTRLWLWMIIPLFIVIMVAVGTALYLKQCKRTGNYTVGYKIGGLS